MTLRFDTEPYRAYLSGGTTDGHNYVGLGISPNDGKIHIVWGLHLNEDLRMRYLYSTTGCMERRNEEFTAPNCRFELRNLMTNRTNDEKITYPKFINDVEGRLWYTQRWDSAERANQYLNSYNERTHEWTLLGAIIRGETERSTNNNFEFRVLGRTHRTPDRGIYIGNFAFDKNNRMHIEWSWREHVAESEATWTEEHGLNYAYSDDGGRTWYAQSGTKIGTAAGAVDSERNEDEIISIDDLAQTEVVSVPPGAFFYNAFMVLDAYNNPHIVVGTSDAALTEDEYNANILMTHYWRDTEGTWYQDPIEESADGGPNLMWPSAFFDRQNIMYGLVAKDTLGWGPWNEPTEAHEYRFNDLPPDYVSWQPGRAERATGLLDITLYSAHTWINTNDLVNVPIRARTGNTQVRVRLRNDTRARELKISWITQESTRWEVTRQQRFSTLNVLDREYSTYTFTITDEDWRGTLRTLEIGPAMGVSTGRTSIDTIQIADERGGVVKTWDFDRPLTLYGVEASPADNWSTWQREELLPGVGLANDGGWWAIDTQRYAYNESKVVNFLAVVQETPRVEQLTLRKFDIGGDDVEMEVRFDTDKNGWTAQRDVESFRWSNDGGTKGITGTISGTLRPRLLSPTNLKIPLGRTTGDNVHIIMKNSSEARTATLYFITDTDRTFNEAKSITFPITARSGYRTYDIDMSRVEGWRNSTLYQIRFDPASDGRARRSETFNIDRIYIADE